jgi:hypothetical protein
MCAWARKLVAVPMENWFLRRFLLQEAARRTTTKEDDTQNCLLDIRRALRLPQTPRELCEKWKLRFLCLHGSVFRAARANEDCVTPQRARERTLIDIRKGRGARINKITIHHRAEIKRKGIFYSISATQKGQMRERHETRLYLEMITGD